MVEHECNMCTQENSVLWGKKLILWDKLIQFFCVFVCVCRWFTGADKNFNSCTSNGKFTNL